MHPEMTVLRDADWLTRDRVLAFTRVLLVVLAGAVALIPLLAPAMDVGRDFAAFWTSAQLALHGRAADAYGQAEREALTALLGVAIYPPFFYPPPALFIWLPFALVPFAAAAALWVAGTAAAYALALRGLLKGGSVVASLAFPAAWVCGLFGQNGLLSAALLAGAAMMLERTPLAAGALIGVFVYKPQLAVLAPLAFLAARRWRAFAAAAVTVVALSAASAAVFGIEAWRGFFDVLPIAKSWNAGGAPGFATFASPYAAIRLVGGTAGLAWLVQAAAAVCAIVALVLAVWRRPGGAAEIAVMVAATSLCVPFLGVYDLVILAVPGAWLIGEALRSGWLPYERVAIALLYLSPLIVVPANAVAVPLAPLADAALLALVVRRIRQPLQFEANRL